MIDPELKYCIQCNDEYRAEIEKCANCGIDLITGRQKIEMEEARQQKLGSRTAELSPDDDLVVIRRGPLSDMRHLAETLGRENIGTLMAGDESSCGKGCCPSVYNLLVKREDGMEAHHIIEEEHRRATGLTQHESVNGDTVFNPHENEAQCPACGYSFPTTQTTCPDCGLNFG
ncbi:MAG: hypothetical protein JRF02_09365 [Deltaproteobacteria bacterium]|jgi:predicted amidophosphoribosyltransferase|nr:hypothetical protein [Deltaproteobacteria bacterium]